MSRDFDFPEKVKRIIAQRVNYICSNPNCMCFTSGPNVEDKIDTKKGDCAHIYSGAEDGPRFNLKIDDNFLKNEKNALWLCKNCHRVIDRNWKKYPTELLLQWKSNTEQLVENYIESNTSPIKLFNDIKKNIFQSEGGIPDVDFNIHFAYFNKDFVPGKILTEEDPNLKNYLLFSKFNSKFTIPNKFKYYDLLAKIYLNLNLIGKSKKALSKSIETQFSDSKKILNEGLYAILNNDRNSAMNICEQLKNEPNYYYFLKLMLIENLDELKSIVENIQKAKYSDLNVFLNIAQKAVSFGEFDIARKFTYKALELDRATPNLCLPNAANLLTCVIKSPEFNDLYPSQQDNQDLKNALELIEKALKNCKYNDNDIPQTLLNKAIIHFILGNIDKTMVTIDRIQHPDYKNQAEFLRTRCFFKIRKFEKALNIIEVLLKDNNKNLNYLFMKGVICLNLKKYDIALDSYEAGLEQASRYERKRFLLAKAGIINYLEGQKKSESFLMTVFEKEKDITYLINSMILNYPQDHIEEIVNFFNKKISQHIDSLSINDLCMLGSYFFNINQYNISADLFEKAYIPQMNVTFADKYIRSLIEIDNRIKALKVAQEIRTTQNCLTLIHIESSILEHLGKLQDAEDLSKAYHSEINNAFSALIYGYYLIKNSKEELASETLQKHSDYIDLQPKNFALYCDCLLKLKQQKKAYEELYRFIRNNDDDADSCSLYIGMFFRITRLPDIKKYLKSFEKEIKANCGVTLVSEDDEVIIIFLEDGSNANVSKNEFSPDSFWGNLLIGKQKGDVFTKNDGFIEKKYKIIDVCHKSVLKWNKIAQSAPQKFSKPFVSSIQINLNAENTEKEFEKIFEIVKKDSEEQKKTFEIYENKMLPIGMLSSLCGKNLVHTVYHCLFNNEVKFIASSGNTEERTEALKCVYKKRSLTIDITGCIMLSQFKLWSKLSNAFDEIYVAKSSVEEIEKILIEEKLFLENSPGSLGQIGNKVVLIPRTEAQKKEWKNTLINLKKEIVKHCSIIEESEELNLYKFKQQLKNLTVKIRKSIGKSFIDTLAIALAKNTPLYSEDFVLRAISFESGIQGFWGQVLFDYFLANNLISFDEYYDIVTKLLYMRYQFTHINIPLLMKAINKSNYEVDTTVNLYLDNLFCSNNESVVNIGGGFLYGAIKSTPAFLSSFALIMAFFSKYYEKTKSLGHIIALINFIHIVTGDRNVLEYLRAQFIKWKRINSL